MSDKIARDVRAGLRPLNADRLDALPVHLRREVYRRALAETETSPFVFSLERAAMRLVAACSQTNDVAVRAVATGALDGQALAVAEREVSERARELSAAGRK